jgi:hypothetical protein
MKRKPTCIYSVPPKTVPSYIQRDQLWKDLEEKLKVRHEGADIPYAVVLHGLGGSGKSQLALKYAECKRDEFNPVLWIDATNQELFRSSFTRCATELGILDDQKPQKDTRLRDDPTIRLVLRWLHDRTGEDPEWLVIFDNVDDLTWDIKDVIPEGTRGRLIITSQDTTSWKLPRRGCEKVHVDAMSPQEARMVLLQHLSQGPDPTLEKVCQRCDEVAQKLGYLALAVDLAGAYIGNYNVAPEQAPEQAAEQALMQYLKDFKKHGDELLQKDEFQGLSKERKTIWTVWDTTLERIEKDHTKLPGVLLSFLAHFRGSTVQDQVFRLASLGISAVDDELGEQNSPGLRMFIPQDEEGWDSFMYNQSIDVLARYSLVQRVHGDWLGLGTTMHSLVQWRATRGDQYQKWQGWYIRFMLAACSQLIKEDQPQFRRHLMLHLPDVNVDLRGVSTKETGKAFIWATLGTIYSYEGWWADAERFRLQVMETRKTKLGEDHPDTLTSIANLASTFSNQGRWKEAEQLEVQVMETRKTKLGEDHPDTLTSIANLALTFWNQGRWEEAEQLEVQVMETRKTKLGEDHPDTLNSIANLASTFSNQGRWEEAEQLQVQVMETRKTKLGEDHPDTLTSIANLALTFLNQGRWEEAEQLQVQVMEMSKIKLGEDHPDTLTSMANLASTFSNQGRWEEAEQLQVQVMEMSKIKLGEDHPDTLTSIANLALTFWNQDRWEEAEQLQVQVIETRKTKLGENHPSTLNSMTNLASTFWKQGRLEEAEQLEVQVMKTRKTKLGEDHPSTLTSMANLASTFWNQGRLEEAEQLEVQVMKTRKTKLGEDHPSTLSSMANLAFTWKSSAHDVEAINLLRDCLSKQKKTLGPDHPTTLSISETLVEWETELLNMNA